MLSETTSAQKIIGKVISEKYKTGIPYASISYKNHSKGICADSTGKFEIEDDFLPNDSLIISCVGYFPNKLSISDASKLHEFILNEKVINLSEISVKKRAVFTVLIGSQNNDSKSILMSPIRDNYEVALLMPNVEKAEGVIKNIGFFITKHGKPKTPFRVRIYAMKEGSPAQDLLNENVIIAAKRGHKWLILDVSKYNISIPENGFVVSMEYLFSNNRKYLHTFTVINRFKTKEKKISFGQQIGLTNEFTESFGWNRTNGGQWKKFYYSPMIRSEIEIYK